MNIIKEYEKLKNRIKYLEKLLDSNNIIYQKENSYLEPKIVLDSLSKINIYNNFFKGRNECYAIRFEYNGRTGYMPKVKEKYKYLKKEDKNKLSIIELYEPYSNESLIKHLKGELVVGLYPITSFNGAFFLVFDFDDKSYKDDSKAITNTLKSLNIDYLLEISRSGNGVHVWIFFENEKPAKDIRIIGRYIISKSIERYGIKSFLSYDRMFPNQDYIKEESLGNLIALPLNGASGKKGFTLFVDDDYTPFNDQYDKLKMTKKVNDELFFYLLNIAKIEGDIVTVGDKVESSKLDILNDNKIISIEITNTIEISKKSISDKNLSFIKRIGSIKNPEFYKKQRMRFSTFETPRIIELFSEDRDKIYLPKGIKNNFFSLLKTENIEYEVLDLSNYNSLKNKFIFKGKLKKHQEEVINLIRNKEEGVILAPTGFGKTVVGIKIIEELNVKTLIIVNRVNLLTQWQGEIFKFLNVNDLGILQGKINTLGKDIDIVTIQSLINYENISDIINNYGLILIDEVHHLASVSYEKIVRMFNSKYLYGLTATIKRSDGLEEITKALVGDVLTGDFKYENNLIKLLNINFTTFKLLKNEVLGSNVNDYYEELINDDTRNKLIVKDVKNAFLNNKNILILTNRLDHILVLSKMLNFLSYNLFVVHGRLSDKEKRMFNDKLSNVKENFIILATGSFIGEGFDDDRLDELFLTMPFKWQGTLSQYVGRLNREKENKSEIIVNDYIDINVRFSVNMYEERLKGYKRLGFIINNESYKKNVYNIDNYKESLTKEINESKSCKFLIRKNTQISNSFIESINNDNYLVVENETINAVILDNKNIWYGSLNPFLSINSKDSLIMKINDELLVKNILSEIKNN